MPKNFQLYGVGQAIFPVLPPPVPFETAPTSNQTNYEIGQLAYTPPRSPTDFYFYGGAGNWIKISDADGSIVNVAGTANQITSTVVDGVATLSIPASFAAPGSVTATLGNITATNGNIVLGTAGNKQVYTSVASTSAAGANSAGTVDLVAGTVVVSTTAVTASSLIRLTCQALGTVTEPSALCVSAKSAGTSFTILASQNTDTSTIFWEIVN